MSRLRTPSARKPPLAESASRIPTGRTLRSNTNVIQTPVSLGKTQIPNRLASASKSDLRPEYQSITGDLRVLAKMVEDEFGNHELGKVGSVDNMNIDPSVVYERGKCYEEYSARRNERLRRKSMAGQEKKTPFSLGVTVDSGKKRESKKLESLRKSVPANFSVTATPTSRYSLRSSTKENKKPPLAPVAMKMDRTVADSERRIGTRRTRRI
ncbi:hypothetical protein ACHQM5_024392 [Ranunculus cassubicifolius]